MFDVRRLVVLQEIARAGSLSAAAVALNYTTSAVSQQVTALERDVCCSLLVRGPSGARLTLAGRKLLEHAPAIMGAVAAAERDLASITAARPGVVRIASFASAAAVILPPAIAQVRRALPGVGVELVAVDPDDGVEMLRSGDADAAMVTEVPGERPEFPGISTMGVYNDEFFVVLPLGHRLAGRAEVALAELARDNWVVSTQTGQCPDTRVFRSACQRAGFEPTVSYRAEEYATVQGLVAAGLGVSLVPSLAALGSRPDVAVRRVSGHRPARTVAIATTSPPAPASVLAAVIGFIAAAGAATAESAVCSVAAHASSVA
ncbi:LysR family transcriptional regulator [Mycolicibacter engbaekii]|uniref:LysR family transcriptional regulator n=1 Tax=Mycolicibacter engbaekii TaxID=188915 RepID=A0A1X1TL47_9MYCO|nr:LysR family transcriptional regulator [Mycolicibacter engbaekii]ORV45307.1 LysR family transcriptional regulator [Mycolicibacter engbaekii]